jgi:hypothetical protein
MFTAAVAEEATAVAAGQTTDPGPLYRLLTEGSPAAFVGAKRGELAVGHLDGEVRRYAASAKNLRSDLEQQAVAIEADMSVLYAKVRTERDRLPYLQAQEKAGEYAEVWSLLTWLRNPTDPYQQHHALIPSSLVAAEFTAALNVGEKRSIVPDSLIPDHNLSATEMRPR